MYFSERKWDINSLPCFNIKIRKVLDKMAYSNVTSKIFLYFVETMVGKGIAMKNLKSFEAYQYGYSDKGIDKDRWSIRLGFKNQSEPALTFDSSGIAPILYSPFLFSMPTITTKAD